MARPSSLAFVVLALALAAAALPAEGAGAATITSVRFSGSPAAPTITISGRGLGTLPRASQPPTSSEACRAEHAPGNQGENYGDRLFVLDRSNSFASGLSGPYGGDSDVVSCVGLIVSSFSPTRVVVRPGSDYAKHPYSIEAGARVLVVVNGAQATVTVAYR